MKHYFENDIIRILLSLGIVGYLFSWKFLVLSILLPLLILCQYSLIPTTGVSFAMMLSVLIGSVYFPHIIDDFK